MSRKNFTWRKRAGWGLAISLVVMLGAFWLARAHYENRLRQQIWPAHTPEISSISSSAGASVPTVMLLGDSRIAQWGLPELKHWHVVNAGAGGLTTAQVRLVTPGLLAEFRPDAVVLQAGINDLKFLGLRPEMASTIVSLAASNLESIVYECAGRHCKIIVLETWPAGQPGFLRRLVWSAEITKSVDRLNARLRSLEWPEGEILVVDLFNEAGLKPGAGLYYDTLHFKPEVYQRLTPALEKTLNGTPLPAK
jgi:lysophospholipase L1-like esterase